MDSNASGVAALLEIMRLFSRLYGQSKTHPRANLIFVLSSSGKLNYLGIKKLIDDAVEGELPFVSSDTIYVFNNNKTVVIMRVPRH